MASKSKRYYWIRLPEDFFNDIRIKKLRKLAGGDTFTIIYLKLLLFTVNTEGIITFEGVLGNIYDELAELINEDSENIEVTLTYLESVGYLQALNQFEYECTQLKSLIGSECDSAHRVRELREKQKAKAALQCNADVTPT